MHAEVSEGVRMGITIAVVAFVVALLVTITFMSMSIFRTYHTDTADTINSANGKVLSDLASYGTTYAPAASINYVPSASIPMATIYAVLNRENTGLHTLRLDFDGGFNIEYSGDTLQTGIEELTKYFERKARIAVAVQDGYYYVAIGDGE
ncbi:MAG: hypothetical protein LBS29_04240 [Endomicrobium sp.]|jgi:hypothetical protein|nr:hypothetical protein [Endomicrobium sp.]